MMESWGKNAKFYFLSAEPLERLERFLGAPDGCVSRMRIDGHEFDILALTSTQNTRIEKYMSCVYSLNMSSAS